VHGAQAGQQRAGGGDDRGASPAPERHARGERAEREAELLGAPAVIVRADGTPRLLGGLA
jgi:hypothetical protein